jgi:hypothetical protein
MHSEIIKQMVAKRNHSEELQRDDEATGGKKNQSEES